MSESDSEYEIPDYEPSAPWMYTSNKRDYSPLSIQKNGKQICNRKIKKENGKYQTCKKELFRCDWCFCMLCPSLECIPQYMIRQGCGLSESTPHGMCTDCTRITCQYSGICNECEKHHYFDMITDRVAIGSCQASYDSFDLVINLDYSFNGVKRNEVVMNVENNIHVIRCGYSDSAFEVTSEKIEALLNMIFDVERTYDKPIRILFHCYAGVSRSATFAIAYLASKENKSTVEIYEHAKQKRPRIDPNFHFRTLLGLPE